MTNSVKRAELQARLGYVFSSDELFATALRHKSAGAGHNERLEFLGDAILDAVVSEHLFRAYPEVNEGLLTRARSQLVRTDTLARLATRLELGEAMELGRGERANRAVRASIRAGAVEAIIGAIYLDSDYSAAQRVVLALLQEEFGKLEVSDRQKDAKTLLQELTQGLGMGLPSYEVRDASGPAHDRQFRVSCNVQGRAGTEGEAGSRREAEQRAAQNMLDQIGTTSQ